MVAGARPQTTKTQWGFRDEGRFCLQGEAESAKAYLRSPRRGNFSAARCYEGKILYCILLFPISNATRVEKVAFGTVWERRTRITKTNVMIEDILRYIGTRRFSLCVGFLSKEYTIYFFRKKKPGDIGVL